MRVPSFPDTNGYFKKCGVFSHSLTREDRTMRLQCRRSETSRAFSRAALLGRGHPSQTLTYNGSQQWMETEGNSQHANNKVEPSILVTKAIRYSQDTPRIHHIQCQKVILVGRHAAGDNQITGQQLRPLVFFLHNSIIMHSSWVSEVIAVKSNCFWTEETFFCWIYLFLIGTHLSRHFNVLRKYSWIASSHDIQ